MIRVLWIIMQLHLLMCLKTSVYYMYTSMRAYVYSYWLAQSLACLLSLILPFSHSSLTLIQSFIIHSFAHSLTLSLANFLSLSHSPLTHSPIHLLTHSHTHASHKDCSRYKHCACDVTHALGNYICKSHLLGRFFDNERF